MDTFEIVVLILCVVGVLCVIVSFFIKDGGKDRGAATNKSLNDMSKITLAKTSDRMEALVKNAEEEFEEFAKIKVDSVIKEIEEASNKALKGENSGKKNSEVKEPETRNSGKADERDDVLSDLSDEAGNDEYVTQKDITLEEDKVIEAKKENSFVGKSGSKKSYKSKNGKGKNAVRQYGWGEALAIASAEENSEDKANI